MEAQIRLPNGITIKVEGKTQKDLFLEMGSAYEVFGEHQCGLCDSTDIRPAVRTVGDNDFFEFVCNKCFAKMSLGQNKKKQGCLFPKRKLTADGKPDLENGSFGKHRGWTKYRGEPREEGAGPPKKK